MAYTAVQSLFPITCTLVSNYADDGSTVGHIDADVAETWFFFKVPASIPTMQLHTAHWANGAVITANDTNYVQLDILNGATSMATATTKLTTAGGSGTGTNGDTVADAANAFTLSTTVANRRCVAGETITIAATHPGSGQALTAQAVVTAWFSIGVDDLNAS